MRRGLVVAVVLFAAGCAMEACASSGKPTPAQVAAEGAYGASLLQCVDQAKTLAESKSCRARVDAQYGVTQTPKDAGDQ